MRYGVLTIPKQQVWQRLSEVFWKAFSLPVLDSRRLVFCIVLRGKSAQQQAAENPFILDPSYRYFDTGTGHLLAICILMATGQKRVIAKSGENHH